jgi:hypothetical protein
MALGFPQQKLSSGVNGICRAGEYDYLNNIKSY